MVGLLEPKFGIAKKMERREREMGGEAVVKEGGVGMIGVEGEVEGEIKVSEQVKEVAEEIGEGVQEPAVKTTS